MREIIILIGIGIILLILNFHFFLEWKREGEWSLVENDKNPDGFGTSLVFLFTLPALICWIVYIGGKNLFSIICKSKKR